MRARARAEEKSLWGENPPPAWEQWYKENFTYQLEKEHYYDRPYSITGRAFESTPLIGPLLASTIGRLIKPERPMHTEEYYREGAGGEEYLRPALGFGQRYELGELGELPPGAPISPFGLKATTSEMVSRMRQAIGLPGFRMASIKEAITGEQGFFEQEPQLESAGRMYSPARSWYELEVGGGFGSTELLRRLYPRDRSDISYYNPIPNAFYGSWLPGPGERSLAFQHGDPYRKVPRGYMRLPGEGYEAIHPEVEGLDISEYPAIHRYAILSDVAP